MHASFAVAVKPVQLLQCAPLLHLGCLFFRNCAGHASLHVHASGVLRGKVMLQAVPCIVAAQVLDPAPGSKVLDMCAAPGGEDLSAQLNTSPGTRQYRKCIAVEYSTMRGIACRTTRTIHICWFESPWDLSNFRHSCRAWRRHLHCQRHSAHCAHVRCKSITLQ